MTRELGKVYGGVKYSVYVEMIEECEEVQLAGRVGGVGEDE